MQMKPTVRVTETIYGEDSQKGLFAGVNILHDPVASTLGAAGRTVIIEDLHGNPRPTKDGVTVAKSIVPFDSVERMGCEVIKQASLNTAEEAGDGTTTSTILAKAIVEDGAKAMSDKGVNYTDFNRGMQYAVDMIGKELDKMAKKVTLDNIEHVATISANNDNELGSVISEAYRKAGQHGVVLMERSETPSTYVSLTEGFELENGFSSDVFITDKDTGKAEHRNAFVLISNVKIERIGQIESFFEFAITNGQKALVIVSEMEDQVAATLAMNKMKGNIKCIVVKPSHFGVRRKDILQDLAISTGGVMIDEETGDNFDEFWLPEQEGQARASQMENIANVLGQVRKVSSDKHKTVFFNEVSEECREQIDMLKKRLEEAKSGSEKSFLEERIAKISSSVAIVNVGASSETEQAEKADRVDDAIHAVRAALQEGIVAGGGVALFNAASNVDFPKNENKAFVQGVGCVLWACSSPLMKIIENGDIEFRDEDFNKEGFGVNVKTKEVGDMIKMNIIDPVKVTKTALKNAVSAASTLLSTTTTIVNLRRA